MALTESDRLGDRFEEALDSAKADFVASHPLSRAQHQRAAQVLPGGNTRTVLFSAPFPVTLASAQGCTVTSLDGHDYIDFLGEYTAGLYGHSNPVLRKAVEQALAKGWVMGGHIQAEEELARLICERFESIDLLRFTNSGTEANLYAIAAARRITGRDKVVVFDGAYHGGALSFVGAPGALTVPFDFVVAPYNDLAGTLAMLERVAAEVGSIVVEPVQSAGGCIVASHEFLRGLRAWASAHGALLIFDEIVTSRLAPGGVQALCGVRPDLTTLGKYMGGGFSFGAFGGRRDLMQRFDPLQPGAFAHAGTFNNNVFTMAAGAAGLREVYTVEVMREFNARGDRLRERLSAAARRARFPMQFIGSGSIMNAHMTRDPVRSSADLRHIVTPLQELFYFDMLRAGIWLARRGMINLSLPIEEAHCDQLVGAVEAFVDARNELMS